MTKLKNYLEKYYALAMSEAMFSWDMQTAAPRGAWESISKIIGILSAEAFAMSISPEIKGYLDELSQPAPFSPVSDIDKAIVRICRKQYDQTHNIPVAEIREYSELVAASDGVWRVAREENDYGRFAPYLEKIIGFKKKFAEYIGYKDHPYDALLDMYEPDMTVAKLDVFFAQVRERVVPLLQKITKLNKPAGAFAKQPVSKAVQEALSALMMRTIGYDLNRGLLAESAHPFTMGFSKDNVRITTHYHEDKFLSSVFSVLHEGGHALYEQNKSDDIKGTILDTGISMGIHESQSRFLENVIGRSREFWQSVWPEFSAIIGGCLGELSLDEFIFTINAVEPSLIRIEADELTYPLHIMVRYELEKTLMSQVCAVEDLPRMWNEKYREYLGIVPPDDASGILQDVHWSGGMFGYFPSYALGSAYAAQFLAALKAEMDVFALVRDGRLYKITDWLREKIHRHGSVYTPDVIIRQATGQDLNADYYVKYLEDKFSKIYGLA
jgi:carboxypeptidase Taq